MGDDETGSAVSYTHRQCGLLRFIITLTTITISVITKYFKFVVFLH